jgi:hypothetical protein
VLEQVLTRHGVLPQALGKTYLERITTLAAVAAANGRLGQVGQAGRVVAAMVRQPLDYLEIMELLIQEVAVAVAQMLQPRPLHPVVLGL